MTDEFKERVALVTGGSRGIGRACCLRLAQAGAKVAINYRSNAQAAQETVALVQQARGSALSVQADVSDADQVGAMITKVAEKLGPVDLLVNNAGVFHFSSHEELTPQIWQEMLDINLTGVFQVTWAVKDGMIQRGFGRIVNVASIAALRARPMSIAYAATKAGVIGFTKSVAEALAANNIRVNAVAPGLTETDILDGVDQTAIDKLVEATPISRIGTPDDIADVVYFLLSDQSRFTTGQTIVASGGRVMLP